MTVVVGNTASKTDTSGTVTSLTQGITISDNSMIMVFAGWNNATALTASYSDDAGDFYTNIGREGAPSVSVNVGVAASRPLPAGTYNVTVTLTGTPSGIAIFLVELQSSTGGYVYYDGSSSGNGQTGQTSAGANQTTNGYGQSISMIVVGSGAAQTVNAGTTGIDVSTAVGTTFFGVGYVTSSDYGSPRVQINFSSASVSFIAISCQEIQPAVCSAAGSSPTLCGKTAISQVRLNSVNAAPVRIRVKGVPINSLIVIGFTTDGDGNDPTITDGQGNTYTKYVTATSEDSPASWQTQVWTATSSTGGDFDINVTQPSASGVVWGVAVAVCAVSGGSIAVNANGVAGGLPTPYTPTTITPVGANSLILCFFGGEGSGSTNITATNPTNAVTEIQDGVGNGWGAPNFIALYSAGLQSSQLSITPNDTSGGVDVNYWAMPAIGIAVAAAPTPASSGGNYTQEVTQPCVQGAVAPLVPLPSTPQQETLPAGADLEQVPGSWYDRCNQVYKSPTGVILPLGPHT